MDEQKEPWTTEWEPSRESITDYMYRICKDKKQLKWSWKAVATHLNKELNTNYSEKWYRNHYIKRDFKRYEKKLLLTTGGNPADQDKNQDLIEEKLLKIEKEKIKLLDERAQTKAYIRRLAREETLKEIAYKYAEQMINSKPLLSTNFSKVVRNNHSNEGILLISDWHYGMVCDNYWNKFDPDICKRRVNQLLSKVIRLVETEDISKVTVLNLSDLIAGRIHLQIRIESRIDVVTQTMDIAEILAEFLTTLSNYCEVSYYDCLDNHSRIEPNKSDSLELETFVRMIPWYLHTRLSTNSNIKINNNEFSSDIITCNVAGHDVIGVHGHEDNPSTALDKLTLMTHKHYDLLCTAHRHHFSADEQHQTMIISNPSLMGVDSYAEKYRLTSYPAQTFIKTTKENVCECIYRIVLK